MDGFLQRHSWGHVLFPFWADVGGDNCCSAYRSAHRCEICLQTSGCAEETFQKKMSRSACAERVFRRCCQALLTTPGVWRMGFGSYIHKAERTWLMSIPPSSAQPAGLVSWCFWDLPCPDALQMPNPPGPRTIQPQAGCSTLHSPSCSGQEAKRGEDSPRGCMGCYRGWWSWLRPADDGQN